VPWPPWQCFFLGASPDARTGDASRHDQEWKRYIDDNSIRWPIGSRALGNEGIGGVVRETAGSIGYVELGYASKQGLTMGLVRNPAGKFVKASSESVAAASKREVTYLAECMHLATSEVCTRLPYIQLPSDAYAITGDIWLVFSKNPANKTKALSTLDFAKWFLLESKGSKTNWTPLPKEIASESLAAIDEQRIHLSNTKKETSQKSATPIATLEHKSVGVGVDGKPALSPAEPVPPSPLKTDRIQSSDCVPVDLETFEFSSDERQAVMEAGIGLSMLIQLGVPNSVSLAFRDIFPESSCTRNDVIISSDSVENSGSECSDKYPAQHGPVRSVVIRFPASIKENLARSSGTVGISFTDTTLSPSLELLDVSGGSIGVEPVEKIDMLMTDGRPELRVSGTGLLCVRIIYPRPHEPSRSH
jgi:hypothetical protein